MDRNPRYQVPDKAMQTVCVGGVYIVDKRIGYDRRYKIHKHQKKYERRLSTWAKSFNRRRRFIDIVV
ncbi:MAG: hypothetical protein ACJA13_003029 [Paraglaciecola sp.]|jgi:hypothetical protein